jgi:putative membrane protein
MKKIDPEVVSRVEAAIRRLEAESSAEVVVEVRARSGSWAHADARVAALFSFLGLLVLLFSPWHVMPVWVVADVALVYAFGIFAARHTGTLRRLLTSASERRRQVRTEAAALFYERGIANTRAETGVLLYLSLLEGRMELIADRGVLKAAPAMEWNQLAANVHERERAGLSDLEATLAELHRLLAACLPCDHENPDELASAPRFELE